MAADVVVIAMGPWTKLAASWFEGVPQIGAQKAHSIVVKPSSDITADCLFLAHTNKQGRPSRRESIDKIVAWSLVGLSDGECLLSKHLCMQ